VTSDEHHPNAAHRNEVLSERQAQALGERLVARRIEPRQVKGFDE
jgi:hypothetical protein